MLIIQIYTYVLWSLTNYALSVSLSVIVRCRAVPSYFAFYSLSLIVQSCCHKVCKILRINSILITFAGRKATCDQNIALIELSFVFYIKIEHYSVSAVDVFIDFFSEYSFFFNSEKLVLIGLNKLNVRRAVCVGFNNQMKRLVFVFDPEDSGGFGCTSCFKIWSSDDIGVGVFVWWWWSDWYFWNELRDSTSPCWWHGLVRRILVVWNSGHPPVWSQFIFVFCSPAHCAEWIWKSSNL